MPVTIRAQIKDGRIEPEANVDLREGEHVFITITRADHEHRRRQVFLDEANRAFAALRADAQAWQDELDERELWNASLTDGLNND